MFYTFPADLTLDEVRSVVNEHNAKLGVRAFIEADRGDHVIFNYLISFPETFPEVNMAEEQRKAAILRECRGLTFSKSGRVMARKFHKFFNVGQKPETAIDNIDWSNDHVLLEKMDGSMLVPMMMDDGDLRWSTKMGLTDVATPVEDWIASKPEHEAFNELARFCIANDLTPMFEWCSLKQRIVIAYPEDRLVLLAVRNNTTGEYMSVVDMNAFGEQYGVEVVKATPPPATPQELLDYTRGLLDTEGFVVRFTNGHMVKVKAEDYVIKHQVKSDLALEKNILKIIVEDKLDDALPLLAEDDRAEVQAFATAFEHGVEATAKMLTEIVSQHVGMAKKDFATTVVVKHEPTLRPMLFSIFDGKDARETVLSMISKHVSTSTRVNEVRHLFGDIRWVWGEKMQAATEDN